jgi:hypothetical protein
MERTPVISARTAQAAETLPEIRAGDSSIIRISGSNFRVDGTPVGLGVIPFTTGTLTGTLDSGDSIIDTIFFHDGYTSAAGTFTDTIELVPEPSTALLLALGLVGIAAGRRRTAARFH